mgnify:CR=1 FL=1
MALIYSIISTILNSVYLIIRKKSLDTSKMSQYVFYFIWWVGWLILTIIFLFCGFLKYNIFWDLVYAGLTVFFIISTIPNAILSQKIYREDKISNVLPYEQIGKVITIISGFFLFHDASVISLITAVITVLVVMVFSIDFKNHQVPKSLWLIILWQVLVTIKTDISVIVLKKISWIEFFMLGQIISTILYFAIIIFQKKLWDFRQKKGFYKLRVGASFIIAVNTLISYFLLSSIWIVYTILLSFLWTGITLLFSFFFLKDKPTKKNIIMTIIVSLLVWIGFYFKK